MQHAHDEPQLLDFEHALYFACPVTEETAISLGTAANIIALPSMPFRLAVCLHAKHSVLWFLQRAQGTSSVRARQELWRVPQFYMHGALQPGHVDDKKNQKRDPAQSAE